MINDEFFLINKKKKIKKKNIIKIIIDKLGSVLNISEKYLIRTALKYPYWLEISDEIHDHALKKILDLNPTIVERVFVR